MPLTGLLLLWHTLIMYKAYFKQDITGKQTWLLAEVRREILTGFLMVISGMKE